MDKNTRISQIVRVFHGDYLPEQDVLLVGYSAIIFFFDIKTPFPDQLAALSHKHRQYTQGRWSMYTPRHKPDLSLFGHLKFALRYEGIDLLVLKKLFLQIDGQWLVDELMAEPRSAYVRRLWFLYEWLLEEELPIANVSDGNFVDVLDTKLQFAGPSRSSKRHRIRNNLPGVPGFCPLIRKTEKLQQAVDQDFHQQSQSLLGAVHPDMLRRAAAFMLLKDTKASFAIEGESLSRNRSERWTNIIAQAGVHPLSYDEIVRLQLALIEDPRFTQIGYREEGGFIGEHDRITGHPIPDHISAKWQDVVPLMDALIETEKLLKDSDIDAVIAATVIAFGFVFIHPLEDGNGRIHRYLIHHELIQKQFGMPGVVFPVSSVMFDRILKYRETLEHFSKPRLPMFQWRGTEAGNVEVLNETADFYRYFDATHQAEFLYDCIQETIETTLPEEIDYLAKYDRMKQYITQYIDMPDRLVDLLIRFLRQSQGKLSKRARRKEFYALTDDEVGRIEGQYAEIFQQED
ncbi:MAG: cell division protein Fic [marine bacterium B5-7]|nr:MAG: cell division protein Fic [marine bacterium B5-7]